MFDNISDINILAISIATIAHFSIGGLWFTPLFGKAYDLATGVSRKKQQTWPAMYYYGPFISSFIVVIAIAIIQTVLTIESIADAALLGSVVGATLASISFSNAITPNMPRPGLFGAVVGGYQFVTAVLVSVIIYLIS